MSCFVDLSLINHYLSIQHVYSCTLLIIVTGCRGGNEKKGKEMHEPFRTEPIISDATEGVQHITLTLDERAHTRL